MELLVHIALGLVPVLLFLAALVLMDSYKLVHLRAVIYSILVGCLVAISCVFINRWLVDLLSIPFATYSRFWAPLVEETGKALLIVFLIRTHRVGFLVDTAIHGFAIGAGFALVENMYYLHVLTEANWMTWLIRGCGTAIMHGGATMLFGIVSKVFIDRRTGIPLLYLLLGLIPAVGLHALYNRFIISPLLATALLLFVLPLLLAGVFAWSERATREWLGVGFDSDQELLGIIHLGQLSETRVGQYLYDLKHHFSGETVVDMLCLLRIYLELSIRAKGLLLMREAGFNPPVDPAVRASFDEIKYLEKSIGKTGMRAIAPFLHTSSRDLWQLYMLGQK